MRVLIAGYSIRHIACSAARAGHEVFAADCFCDLDLEECSKELIAIPKGLNMVEAEMLIQRCADELSPEALILGSGLEEARIRRVPTLGNSPEKIAKVSDKLWLFLWLEKKGLPCIPTSLAAEDIRFPAVVKPRKGAGGMGCRLVGRCSDLELRDGMIIQELFKGTPASVSVISDGTNCQVIAANEQLIGETWAGADGFRFCGNISPIDCYIPEAAALAQEIIGELGLVGSNGIDLILTEQGPVVVEVNPRFQGSLDVVELSTGLNVFQAHLQAFVGRLPEVPKPRTVAGRAIIYAEEDLEVPTNLFRSWMADIPRPGSKVEKGDPIASVLATGEARQVVLNLLKYRAAALQRSINS